MGILDALQERAIRDGGVCLYASTSRPAGRVEQTSPCTAYVRQPTLDGHHSMLEHHSVDCALEPFLYNHWQIFHKRDEPRVLHASRAVICECAGSVYSLAVVALAPVLGRVVLQMPVMCVFDQTCPPPCCEYGTA